MGLAAHKKGQPFRVDRRGSRALRHEDAVAISVLPH